MGRKERNFQTFSVTYSMSGSRRCVLSSCTSGSRHAVTGTITFWTVKSPGDIWIVEIWTVKTGIGLRLRLGLGLIMTVQFMTVQILTVQLTHVIRERQPPTFWPMSIVVKRLDGSRCHLVWTMEVRVGPDHIVLDGNPAPP